MFYTKECCMLIRALLVLAAVGTVLVGATAASPASASPSSGDDGSPVSVTYFDADGQEVPVRRSDTAPRAASSVRVCAPKRCVTVSTSRYCPNSRSKCGSKYARFSGAYCSPSVGCFTLGGVNYFAARGPLPTPKQQQAIAQCALSIGGTILSASAGGPIGLTMFGVGMTVWGCASA